MSKYTIGVDFGSLSARAVLVDVESGEEISVSVKEYKHGVISEALPCKTPLKRDWYLQHPEDYLEALGSVIRGVMEEARVDNSQIIGIGTDFTGCTMLPVLEDGTPLCMLDEFVSDPNAYVKLWKHHSSQSQADRMTQMALERKEKFIRRYGGKISSEWFFPKLWQTLEESPKVYDRAYCFIEAADWIVFQMTGKLLRNTCAAGAKALWHKKDGYPSKEYFKALDSRLENVIEEKCRGTIQSIGTKAGEITEKGAALTGLAKGTPVAVGHFDAHGATVGAGIVSEGRMLVMIGTSSCHEIMCREEHEVVGICGYVEDGIVPGYFGYEAGQSSVGDLFSWFIDNCIPAKYLEMAKEENISIYDYLNYLALKKAPGESGIIALDWWNGNRTVLVDGNLTGMLLGCTLQTRPEDIYRALVEATAFGTRKIIETFEEYGVSVRELVMAGGIAKKNPFIMQIYADITGKTIKISGSMQNAALSSAIWGAIAAGEAAGGYDDIAKAAEKLGKLKNKEFVPNGKYKAVYDALYEEYMQLHDYFGRGGNDVMKRLKRLSANEKEDG